MHPNRAIVIKAAPGLTVKSGYSFSTMWHLRRHRVGQTTIVPMIDKGDIRISSMHNIFPFIADRDYDTRARGWT